MKQDHFLRAGDCLELLREIPDKSVDLVFTSPPYEAARTYGIDFNLSGMDWVTWAAVRYVECCRVSRGLVAWVVQGRTRNFQWSATPALLMAELHRMGVKLRNPPIYQRVGIPGSGGPDWFRSDYEWVICASDGRLPWSDNTSCGHEPIYGPGGPPSHRTTASRGYRDGDPRTEKGVYRPPQRANPGNVIKCRAGGGHMGHPIAHLNEAPFPERLAEFFILSCCPPGGTVLDCFCGSGTTNAVAEKTGRNSIGFDIRQSQIELAKQRLESIGGGR